VYVRIKEAGAYQPSFAFNCFLSIKWLAGRNDSDNGVGIYQYCFVVQYLFAFCIKQAHIPDCQATLFSRSAGEQGKEQKDGEQS
jgi:hypothetical protein